MKCFVLWLHVEEREVTMTCCLDVASPCTSDMFMYITDCPAAFYTVVACSFWPATHCPDRAACTACNRGDNLTCCNCDGCGCVHAAPEGSNAYGFIRLFQDHIEIKGVGSVTSRKLLLPSHLISV